MPVESRPSDTFTKDNLLIGFSVVEFTPALSGGGFGTPVMLGILGGQELQKEVELLQLQRGDSGTLTVDREVVSKLEASFELELFNFREDIAAYIFGAPDGTAVSAAAAQSVVDEEFIIPNPTTAADAERIFIDLANGDIDESTFVGTSVTCNTITAEAVGTGDGVLGAADGDFSLDFKPLVLGDVTSITVGGTAQTIVATEPIAGEVQVTVGTGSTSGDLDFGTIPASGAAIVATYTPSHSFANLTDYVADPTLGRIRMLNVNGATDAVKGNQHMLVDYSYNRKAHTSLKPFTQTSQDGKCTIKHLTDIGVNFIWDIPSATIILTDEALTFGAEEFGTATLKLNINDSGGTDRFGTIELSNETEAAA